MVYNHQKQRTVIKCFAGCPDEAVLDRLGLQVRDLFDRPPPDRRSPVRRHGPPSELALADRALLAAGLPLEVHKQDRGRPVARPRQAAAYIYRWPDGRPAGKVIRYRTACEYGYVKSFSQARPTESGWQPGGFPRLPFRLPEVLLAIELSRDIIVCEGESDVLTAAHAGLTATCNAGGATNWHYDHATWLAGAHRVWIVADRDAPGYRHAAKVAHSLRNTVPHLRVVQARDGKDLTDHCNAGHHITELDPVPLLDAYYSGPESSSATSRLDATER
ncbi:toprim domain-containing protein [Nocardia huaxiensis]|uniref:toprim domain-containing protein n=1 Tax=Nocardia huaxiensis TaxID=2755382 RepID=UPI001E5379CE|nr:toprim domain-containing protein [Nocardia huaxiensis]UFS98766.1 toprim domain-containing protein [Nocardia huaxiensis]